MLAPTIAAVPSSPVSATSTSSPTRKDAPRRLRMCKVDARAGRVAWVGNIPPTAGDDRAVRAFLVAAADGTVTIVALNYIKHAQCAFVELAAAAEVPTFIRIVNGRMFLDYCLVCAAGGPPRITQGSRAGAGSRQFTVPHSQPPTQTVHAASEALNTVVPSHNASLASGLTQISPALAFPHATHFPQPHQFFAPNPIPHPIYLPPILPVNTRIFIMKAYSHADMNFAFSHSVWSTLARNESRLNEAFFVHAAHVFLIFGVNGDGGFCGFARMLQGIGEYSQALALGVDTNMWSRDSIEPQPVNMTMWDSPFRIEWVSNTFVPFKVFDHLRNPWNAGKPIRMSRDGTEVEPHVGLQLLQIISAHSGLNGFLDLCKYMPTAIVG